MSQSLSPLISSHPPPSRPYISHLHTVSCLTHSRSVIMPPERGRASQACTACRKQKTRCYTSANHRGACLRCERIQEPCSLTVSAEESVRNVVDVDAFSVSGNDR